MLLEARLTAFQTDIELLVDWVTNEHNKTYLKEAHAKVMEALALLSQQCATELNRLLNENPKSEPPYGHLEILFRHPELRVIALKIMQQPNFDLSKCTPHDTLASGVPQTILKQNNFRDAADKAICEKLVAQYSELTEKGRSNIKRMKG